MSTEQPPSATSTPVVNAARRSLLRGSLAAPVVMTIAPGAAVAQATGSIYGCVQNGTEIPSTAKEALASPTTDSFFRVGVTATKANPDTHPGIYIFNVGGVNYQIDYATGDVGLAPAPLPALTGSTKTFQVIQIFDDKGNNIGFPTRVGARDDGWASWPACYNSLTVGVHRHL